MSGYCTTTDLQQLTGSGLSTVVLQAIIDQGGREIDAYLAPYGLSGSSSIAAVITANIKLAQAELYNLQRIDVDHPMSYGSDGSLGAIDTVSIMKELRSQAFKVLDDYIAFQPALALNRHTKVINIRGR